MAPEKKVCNCNARPLQDTAWEGTAMIHHGSVLKFGCLSFVFAIAALGTEDE